MKPNSLFEYINDGEVWLKLQQERFVSFMQKCTRAMLMVVHVVVESLKDEHVQVWKTKFEISLELIAFSISHSPFGRVHLKKHKDENEDIELFKGIDDDEYMP